MQLWNNVTLYAQKGKGPKQEKYPHLPKDKTPEDEYQKQRHIESDYFPNRVPPMPHEKDKKKGPKF